MLTKKKTAILVLALAMCIGVASAALLQYYAKIQTTVNVTQGILVDGQGYETPITETITGAGGKKLYTWHTITNLGDLPATVTFSSAIEPDDDGVTVEYFENTAVLILENKVPKVGESNWTIINDDTKAFLTYNLIGKNFVYTLEAFGLKTQDERVQFALNRSPNEVMPSPLNKAGNKRREVALRQQNYIPSPKKIYNIWKYMENR